MRSGHLGLTSMALFGKERERLDRPRGLSSEPGVPASGPAAGEAEMLERERVQPGETGGTSAFLGKGSHVSGKLQFEGTVRIEGHVDGEISAQDTLIIGESAVVNAQVTGSSIVIHGRVTGDVTAQKRLEIRAPGKLFGNSATPSLAIHDGAVSAAQCAMGGPAAMRAAKTLKATVIPKDDRPGRSEERRVGKEWRA